MAGRAPAYLALIIFAAVALLVALAASGFGGSSPSRGDPPPQPSRATVTFNFLGGPSLVFVCWDPVSGDVTFYDVQVTAFASGQPREEVRYGVSPTECGEASGVGEYMWQPDLYHFAVRACNNNGCSDWTHTNEDGAYWYQVPCADASGRACGREIGAGSSR